MSLFKSSKAIPMPLRCLALFLIVMGVSVNSTQAQEKKEALRDEFTKMVRDNFSTKEAAIKKDGRTELRKAVDRGVEALAKDDFPPEKVKMAQTNLQKLIAAAKKEAGDKPVDAAILKKLLYAQEWSFPPFCTRPE